MRSARENNENAKSKRRNESGKKRSGRKKIDDDDDGARDAGEVEHRRDQFRLQEGGDEAALCLRCDADSGELPRLADAL